MRFPVPASAEVIEHHITRHECDEWIGDVLACPCGSGRMLVCESCRQPVVVATVLEPACAHVKGVLANGGHRVIVPTDWEPGRGWLS